MKDGKSNGVNLMPGTTPVHYSTSKVFKRQISEVIPQEKRENERTEEAQVAQET